MVAFQALRRGTASLRRQSAPVGLGLAWAGASLVGALSLLGVLAWLGTRGFQNVALAIVAGLVAYDVGAAVAGAIALPGPYAALRGEASTTAGSDAASTATSGDEDLPAETSDAASTAEASDDDSSAEPSDDASHLTVPTEVPVAALAATARTVREHGWSVLRAGLATRLAALGLAVALSPLVLGVALAGVTVATAGLYATETVLAPPIEPYAWFGLGLLLLAWVVGKLPVALAAPLALEGVPPRRAWLASVRLVASRPRAAGGLAALRVGLAAVPALVALAVVFALPDDTGWEGIVVLVGAFAVAAAVVRPLELAATARGVELLALPAAVGVEEHGVSPGGDHDASPGDAQDASTGVAQDASTGDVRDASAARSEDGALGRPPVSSVAESGDASPFRPLDRTDLVPSRRTLALGLALVLVVTATAAVRVTDARPNAEAVGPAAVDGDDPDELYRVARERSAGRSVVATYQVADGNWSESGRDVLLRSRQAVDRERRVATLDGWLGREDGELDRTVRSQGTDGRWSTTPPRRNVQLALARRSAGNWTVHAAPEYADVASSLAAEHPPRLDVEWRVAAERPNRTVLATDDEVAFAYFRPEPNDSRVEFASNSTFRAWIDPSSQRVERIVAVERYVIYESEDRAVVENRVDSRTVLRYEYDDVDVERPEAVEPRPIDYAWDVLYY